MECTAMPQARSPSPLWGGSIAEAQRRRSGWENREAWPHGCHPTPPRLASHCDARRPFPQGEGKAERPRRGAEPTASTSQHPHASGPTVVRKRRARYPGRKARRGAGVRTPSQSSLRRLRKLVCMERQEAQRPFAKARRIRKVRQPHPQGAAPVAPLGTPPPFRFSAKAEEGMGLPADPAQAKQYGRRSVGLRIDVMPDIGHKGASGICRCVLEGARSINANRFPRETSGFPRS
jgi:hypothetical protein